MRTKKPVKERVADIAEMILTVGGLFTALSGLFVVTLEVLSQPGSFEELLWFGGVAILLWLMGAGARSGGVLGKLKAEDERYYLAFAVTSILLAQELLRQLGVSVFKSKAFELYSLMFHSILGTLVSQAIIGAGLLLLLFWAGRLVSPQVSLIMTSRKQSLLGGVKGLVVVGVAVLGWVYVVQDNGFQTFLGTFGEELLNLVYGMPLLFYLRATFVGSRFVRERKI